MSEENVFKTVYKQGYDYFTENHARIVLFFALCAVVVLVFIAAIAGTTTASSLMVMAMLVAMCATAYDTWEQRKAFQAKIEATEMDYFARIAEKSGEKAAEEADGVFGERERAQIKKKMRDFKITFIVKLVFIAILIALLISLIS